MCNRFWEKSDRNRQRGAGVVIIELIGETGAVKRVKYRRKEIGEGAVFMLPEQFLHRMQEMLGEEYRDFVQSFEREHYRGLRVNVRKTSVEEFLKNSPFDLRAVPWTKNGFYYREEQQPGKHPFHEAGLYYIQEPSAMAPVPFLEVKPGERVLDLCAAPGGKTTQLADALQGEGLLISNEIHPSRAKILAENVERMGVVNALVLNESPEKLSRVFPGYFDKVLVDAPCSGEGMFRKNEDACGEWSPENVRLCADRQREVLDAAAVMLAPGGRLVYSTCTFAPEENEGSISGFLERHPEFHIKAVSMPEKFVPGRADWLEKSAVAGSVVDSVTGSAEGATDISKTMRLMPHRIQGEGHYLAVLEKDGESGSRAGSLGGMEKSVSSKDYKEFTEFAAESLNRDSENQGNAPAWLSHLAASGGTYIRFGEQLYLAPEAIPALKGLKVLRPGLHLGTLKKGRFEPSHALALALHKGQIKQYVDLPADSLEVRQYLTGQTLVLGENVVMKSGENDEIIKDGKGWCLICVEGYSLGWGKLAGSIVKNHYPKGLRKG